MERLFLKVLWETIFYSRKIVHTISERNYDNEQGLFLCVSTILCSINLFAHIMHKCAEAVSCVK